MDKIYILTKRFEFDTQAEVDVFRLEKSVNDLLKLWEDRHFENTIYVSVTEYNAKTGNQTILRELVLTGTKDKV